MDKSIFEELINRQVYDTAVRRIGSKGVVLQNPLIVWKIVISPFLLKSFSQIEDSKLKKILLILFSFVYSIGFTQDVIVKKDGSTILSKVLEVNTSDIKYKKHSNLNGPTYTILKSELLSINYENGESDKFKIEDNGNASEQKPSASNDSINQVWLAYMNNRTAAYKGQQTTKKAIWQYRILKFHHDSKVADNNVFITCSVSNDCNEQFSGKRELEADITFKITNSSDNIIYIDLGNCFFKAWNKTEAYYKNTATQTSTDGNVGMSVNAGTITNVLGIGGIVGDIANGINIGGSRGSSTGVTVFSQRVIALAPHSDYSFEAKKFYEHDPKYSKYIKTEKYAVGSCVSFPEPQSINNCNWNLIVTYSTGEDFKTKNTMNIGIYSSECITIPRWRSGFLGSADKFITYDLMEPVHYIYAAG